MKMKSCPFCDSQDVRYSENKPDGYLFWCGNCGALGPNDVSFENAVKMWNLRRPTADLLAACEEMIEQHGWVPDSDVNPEPIPCPCDGCVKAIAAIAKARGNE